MLFGTQSVGYKFNIFGNSIRNLISHEYALELRITNIFLAPSEKEIEWTIFDSKSPLVQTCMCNSSQLAHCTCGFCSANKVLAQLRRVLHKKKIPSIAVLRNS